MTDDERAARQRAELDAGIRRTSMVVRNFDRPGVVDELGEDCWYVVVEEAYSGDRPAFRTEALELQVHNEAGTDSIEIAITPMELLDLGLGLAAAGQRMLEQAEQVARRMARQ